MKNALSLVICLLLAGCGVYNSELPEQLPGPLPEKFTESASTTPFAETGRFWEQFNDPKLNELTKIGLAGNYSVKQAIAGYNQFLAMEKISKSSYLPSLSLSGSGGMDKQLTTRGTFEGNSFKLAVTAGYEIDLWNKLENGRNAASFNLLASVADIKTAYISIAAQIADFYYLAVEQRAQLALNEQIIASQVETLARIESRYEAGLVPALDVYQARQNIIAAKTNTPIFQANLAQANHTLAVLLGQFPSQDLTGELAELPEILLSIPPGLPSELISRRPDIEAALLRIKGKDEEIAAAIADRFPSFNLTAGLGSGSLDYASQLSGSFWSLLLDATMPIFDYGRRLAEVDRRKAVLEQELAGYHQTVLEAFQEVENALVANQTGKEQIRLLEKLQRASAATLKLAEDQYFAGLTDYLSVLTSQKNHFDIQSKLLSARKQLISNRIGLFKALGGDWMAEDINNRLQENGETK